MKIEGYMSISDEEAHHRFALHLSACFGPPFVATGCICMAVAVQTDGLKFIPSPASDL